MSQEKNNLAAGRLGTPGGRRRKKGAPGASAKSGNYGVGRLGIVSPSGPVDPPQAQPEPQPKPKPRPAGDPGRKTSAQEMAEILRPQSQSTDRGRARDSGDAYYEEPPFGRRHDEQERRRRRALIVAAVGGMLAVLLVVAFWTSRGDGTGPQAASAQPAQVTTRKVSTPAPTRSVGRDTRHLAARPRRQAVPAQPEHDPDDLWAPAPPATRRTAKPSIARRIPPRPRRPLPPEPAEPPAMSPPPPPPAPRPAPRTTTPKPKPAAHAPKPAPATQPAEPAVVAPPDIGVTCIMRGFGPASAIINNRLIKVGESINGAKLTGIDDFAIEVEFKGKTFQIAVTSKAPPPPPPPAEPEPAEDEVPEEE